MQITFEMATAWQALACTWFFYTGLKASLMGLTLWKKIYVLVQATGENGAQSWSKLIFLWFHATISRQWKIKNFWIYIFRIIFKTNLTYHFDRIFLNQNFRSNTALKMQSDFKCIFLPKMDQSLRPKISGAT